MTNTLPMSDLFTEFTSNFNSAFVRDAARTLMEGHHHYTTLSRPNPRSPVLLSYSDYPTPSAEEEADVIDEWQEKTLSYFQHIFDLTRIQAEWVFYASSYPVPGNVMLNDLVTRLVKLAEEYEKQMYGMDSLVSKALEDSISNWEKRAEGKYNGPSGRLGCPLCQLFNPVYLNNSENNCRGCPVKEKTGKQFCHGTPYIQWTQAKQDKNEEEMKQHAAEEVTFLKSLRPKEV